MRLEDEIKQKEFRNQYQKVLINILYTNNYLSDKLSSIFKKHNLTRQQFNVLRILRGQYPEPVSINVIRDRMLDKMSDASRIVERLRIKKLVERRPCKDDRRAVDILINDEGLKVLKEIDGSMVDFDNNFNNLTDEEADLLNELLDKVRS